MKQNTVTLFRKSLSGFTIVELSIVIVVIGILSTIGVSAYNGARSKAYDIAIINDADAMDSSLTNEQVSHGSGVVTFGDIDGDGEDDGYHYSDALAGDPTIAALNSQLDFKPTKGNIVDVKTTNDGKEYCIRVYNEKAKVWNNPFNAYEIASSRDVTGGYNSCEYQEGAEPTIYSGGAIPGAYEEIYTDNATYDWVAHAADDGSLPERVEVAIIAPGGNGGGLCGGGGGGVWTTVIPRNGNPGPFNIVVGKAPALGTNAGVASPSSSFGSFTATGGITAPNSCGVLSLGVGAGTGGVTNGPDGQPSHKYGAGGAGGKGGAYLTLGVLMLQPGSALTGGGGAGGSTGLFAAANGGNGTFGGGGGGGAGVTNLLLITTCSSAGAGGNAQGGGAGQGGGSCSGTKGGVGGNGNIGGGGGGSGASSGVNPGKGGDGQVRVLTCFESTCNPISTPIP